MQMLPTLFFILGAIVASFVGVVAARLATGQSFVRGRSRCDACTTPLNALALVPILSYGVSRGRATCCGARISLVSPLTEALLGALFVLAYLKIGLTSALPFFLLALGLMLLLVLYDFAHQILPPVPLVLFVLASAYTGFLLTPSLDLFLSEVSVAFCIALFIASINLFSRGRAMGFADAPFTLGCALLVGGAALPGILFSFWIGAVIGIVILARRPRGSRMGVEVPFAPYLAAGFLLAYFTQWNPLYFAAAIHS